MGTLHVAVAAGEAQNSNKLIVDIMHYIHCMAMLGIMYPPHPAAAAAEGIIALGWQLDGILLIWLPPLPLWDLAPHHYLLKYTRGNWYKYSGKYDTYFAMLASNVIILVHAVPGRCWTYWPQGTAIALCAGGCHPGSVQEGSKQSHTSHQQYS